MDEFEVNDWLCRSDILTVLREKELLFRVRHQGLRPDILNTRHGSVALIGKGVLSITFELIQMSLIEAKDEGDLVTDIVLRQMRLSDQVASRSIDLRPLHEPTPTVEQQAKIIPFPRHE